MTDIEIRQATLDDLDGLARDSADLFAEDGVTRDRLRDPDWPRDSNRAWCAGLIAAPDALVLVAIEENAVVGHLVGTFSPASSMWSAARAELVSTHVAPAYRGQGIGGRMVEDFIDWGRERGAVRLHVSAYTSNSAAIRFYQRYGFVPLSIDLALDVD